VEAGSIDVATKRATVLKTFDEVPGNFDPDYANR
jgi:hypothetical protein